MLLLHLYLSFPPSTINYAGGSVSLIVAQRATLYECQEELRSVLEGWLIVKIRHGDKLSVMGRINLNSKMPVLKEAQAHG